MSARAASSLRTSSSSIFHKRYLEHSCMLTHVRLLQLHDQCTHAAQGRTLQGGYCLLYMLSGCGTLQTEASELKLPQRHAAWLQSDCAYRISSDSREPIRLVAIEWQPIGELLRQHTAVQDFESCRVIADRTGMDGLLIDTMRELERKDDYTLTMVDVLVSRLLMLALRELRGVSMKEACWDKSYGKKELVYRAVQYIDQEVDAMTELGEVSKQLGYSHSHLSHAFREEMGMSMQAYWAQRRMMRAMNRLQSGHSSITQISEYLHYRSIHAFSKAFKKATGFTPSEYQALYGSDDREGYPI
ncbi:helix-turn-helix transcriptional regulator [Paenibacillus sp. J5C_2022]|uniref:helix-turn-helix transcriptional regulator n=1 Tax=Paenibacillus sp. J5C2022 TaxID=2977129 RepID=UPI0021D1FF59|nr:helix-turn-helix transcriptional regulator [Paenibacillus sp. J5C2022]MCU6712252.1 helix-turn-helix transcriptional regulator [Paenibacillus sp. J5C2022]